MFQNFLNKILEFSDNGSFKEQTKMLVRDSKISYENAKCCFLPKINSFVAKN